MIETVALPQTRRFTWTPVTQNSHKMMKIPHHFGTGRLFIKDVSTRNLFVASLLATGFMGPVNNIVEKGRTDFRALNVQERSKMIQGTFLATLAKLFRVPPIRRDRGLNSRIVSCLCTAPAIAVTYVSCYSALRYTGIDCM